MTDGQKARKPMSRVLMQPGQPAHRAPPVLRFEPAYPRSIRKRIEEAFGWMKTIAGRRKTRFRGIERVGWFFAFAAAAYNRVRLPKLV
jgi:hypothetical protein